MENNKGKPFQDLQRPTRYGKKVSFNVQALHWDINDDLMSKPHIHTCMYVCMYIYTVSKMCLLYLFKHTHMYVHYIYTVSKSYLSLIFVPILVEKDKV